MVCFSYVCVGNGKCLSNNVVTVKKAIGFMLVCLEAVMFLETCSGFDGGLLTGAVWQ